MRCARTFRGRGALVTQRDEAIVVPIDKACTSWASWWLAFQRRAVKAFPSLDLNFQVPNEEEVEKSSSESETDLETFWDAPLFADYPGDPKVLT